MSITAELGRGEVVIVCLGCLADREVENGRRAGACPGCNYVGWSEITDLARDETFDLTPFIGTPRLRGRELRAALAAFPFPPIPVPR
jgi:hypothetical protein